MSPSHFCVRRLVGLTLLACSLTALACRRTGTAGPITIAAVAGATPADGIVRVVGLSTPELSSLRDARLDEAAWAALVRVSVSDNDSAPIVGRYVVTGTALEFHPRFPFDGGRSYTVRVDLSRLPSPRTAPAVVARIQFERGKREVSTTVTTIFPSGDVWPENMLRFYVYFSAPMSRGQGTKYVHLVDEAGAEVPDAILAAYSDLWNADATRLTVFFDPGRVKRGIGPNVKMGRAIVSGRRYAITVDAAWPDAQGQPLAAPFRRGFTAGPAAYRALDTVNWRVAAPRAGTREPLTVTFPAPLDRALLDRAIGVRADGDREVAGRITVGPAETTWQYAPDAAWTAGAYQIVALTLLEDPAGNKIGRAFEVLSDAPASDAGDPEMVRIPVQIR